MSPITFEILHLSHSIITASEIEPTIFHFSGRLDFCVADAET